MHVKRNVTILLAALLLLGGISLNGCKPDPEDEQELQMDIDKAIALTRSGDPDDREDGAEDLGDLGPAARRGIPDLIRLLDDPEEDVREKAAEALGEMGPDAAPAVPKLRQLAQLDPEDDVRDEAIDAMKKIGPVGVPPVSSTPPSSTTPPPPPPPPSTTTPPASTTPPIQTSGLLVSASAGNVQPYASNAAYGQVDLAAQVSGGSGNYSYQWSKLSGGGFIGSNMETANPRVVMTEAGQYTWQVNVTDASAGKIGQASVSVISTASSTTTPPPPPPTSTTPPPPPPPPPTSTGGALAVSVAATPTTGSGTFMVTLTATPSGGQPPYTYQWGVLAPEGVAEPAVTNANQQQATFTVAQPGDYYCACTVRDSKGDQIAVASVKVKAQ